MKDRYFDLAIRAARHSEHPKYRVGAVVERRGHILGVGFNSMKTHPKSNTYFRRIHAELKAVLNAQEDVTGADIYVARLIRPVGMGCAYPCPACEAMLIESGIRRVYATNEKGERCLWRILN